VRRALLAIVLMSGCALSSECKMMGCSSGVSIIGASADARVCLDDVCTTFDGIGRSSGAFARFDDVHEADAKHVLTVDGTRYAGPISFGKLLPNGPNCGPRCYQAGFALADGKLEPQPG
jgi:hypothetical protein